MDAAALEGENDLISTDIMAYYYEDGILHLKNGLIEPNSIEPPEIDKHSDAILTRIKGIWETFLKRNIDDWDSDFFSLGGNSLLLIQVLEMLNQEFSMNITVMDLFRYTSLRKLSAFIDNTVNGGSAGKLGKETAVGHRNLDRRAGRRNRK